MSRLTLVAPCLTSAAAERAFALPALPVARGARYARRAHRDARNAWSSFASFSVFLIALTVLASGCTRSATPDAPALGDDWIEVSVTLDQDLIEDTDGDAIAMIEVSASAAPIDTVPARLALVMDTSGSMEGQKMEEARMAAHALVDGLNDGDELTIISYSDAAEVHLERWRARADRSAAHEAIDQIETEGNTCVSCGLQAAYDVFRTQPSEGVSRVVLLSDGHANRGITDATSLEHFVGNAYAHGNIDTSTIGLGRLHDEVRLGRLANAGQADYYFLANTEQLDDLLERELNDLHRTSVTNVVVRVQPGDGVGFGAVHHTNAQWSNEALLLPIGQLAVGESRQFLVPLALPAGNMGRAIRVQADFSDVEGDAYRVERDAYLHRTQEVAAIDASRNPKVGEAFALLVAAANTEAALDLYAVGDSAGASRMLDANEEMLEMAADVYDADILRQEAQVAGELRDVLEAAPIHTQGASGGGVGLSGIGVLVPGGGGGAGGGADLSSTVDAAVETRARGNAINQRARARERRRGQAAAAPSWHESEIVEYDEMQ